MSDATTTVGVKILDKEYQVACPAEEVDALTTAARHLDEQMRLVRDNGSVFGLDRIAVMAALNISHELLAGRKSDTDTRSRLDGKLDKLNEHVSQALADHKQLNL